MSEIAATLIDNIHSIDRTEDLSLITLVMVSGGSPLTVANPVEAASKLWIGLLDVFRRDGRNLQERRSLVQEEYAMTVSRLQIHDVLLEAPATPAEQFGLSLSLDDGLSVNLCLPHHLVENIVAQGQRALELHRSSETPKPN